MPTPTLPRLEKSATWFALSVKVAHGALVVQVVIFVPLMLVVRQSVVKELVMFRGSSVAPTVITFFAVAGDWMVSLSPPSPESLPAPELPAEKTNKTGCEPVTR